MAREGQGYPCYQHDMMMIIYIYIYIYIYIHVCVSYFLLNEVVNSSVKPEHLAR